MHGNTGNNSFWHVGAAIAIAMSLSIGLAASTHAATEKVLYSFKGGSDGASPTASLIKVGPLLYGTTSGGGTGTCNEGGQASCGTVFSIDPVTGVEKVIYSFKGDSDGDSPAAGLINVIGKLYGSTTGGGANGDGTVFSITGGGREKVLYAFKGGDDGISPVTVLTDLNSKLYGTTEFGGKGKCSSQTGPQTGCGTVFSIDPVTGSEKILHSFRGGSDGVMPMAALIDVNGTLFGTTLSGGSGACSSLSGSGCGTVFSINPATGREKVLYSFMGGSDGAKPSASLISVKGNFYGTTYGGGQGTCTNFYFGSGCGTVFSINRATRGEKVLYSFVGGSDGANPAAGLADFEDVLYGTTQYGGSQQTCNGSGCGAVFSISPKTNTEALLWSFQGYSSDGSGPSASLIEVKNTFYGTTIEGGANGDGTVFSIKP